MATEKLTIVPALSVRVTESQDQDIRKLAELYRMERGEYIRHLVAQDLEKQRLIWSSRNQLFAAGGTNANETACDNGGHEI